MPDEKESTLPSSDIFDSMSPEKKAEIQALMQVSLIYDSLIEIKRGIKQLISMLEGIK